MDPHIMDMKYISITKEAIMTTIMITMMVTLGLWTLKNAFKTSTILFIKMFNKVLIPNTMIMTTMMDIIMIMRIIMGMTNTIMRMKINVKMTAMEEEEDDDDEEDDNDDVHR